MFKKQIEFSKLGLIICNKDTGFFNQQNTLRTSLDRLFQQFWIYNKKELYLVGGCVRDLILGKEPKDYDLCTNATPDEVKKICDSLDLDYFDSGLKHGTITIMDTFFHKNYEITTYRIDGKYTDNRRPDSVTFTPSLEEDLKRRDFTINSMAYDLLKKELVMLDKSCMDDLNMGVIRTVGNPKDRFSEDGLRMLRAIRFAAQLGFTIEPKTYQAIKDCAPLINLISKERIRDELSKILMSDNPQALEFIVNTGLENNDMWGCKTYIGDMVNCEHQNPYHYTDVFHHTMDVIKRLPKNLDIRWAGLFHDIGKPVVKKLKPGTTDHYRYIGHPEESARIADEIMDILKFPNNNKEYIHKVVLYHDYPLSTCSMKKFKEKLAEIGVPNFEGFIKLREADALAHKLSVSTSFAIDAIQIVKDRFMKVRNNHEPISIHDLAINGDDIVSDGFLQGEEIGECLRWMLGIVLEHPEYNTKEKLLEYLQTFKEMSFQNS